jgi:hypothetical protein
MNTMTSADETRIAYDRTGAGDPLVLVCGAFRKPARSATRRARPLARAHFE